MNNFEFHNPTKIIFGKDQIANMRKEIPKNARVLMLYGGGSIKKNGVYDQVKEALKPFDTFEFEGIPANPEYEILLKAVELIKEEKVDFLLAVGGGSVLDGVKFIAAAAVYKGNSPWDLLTQQLPIVKGMPFGSVLTLPATGSEMNMNSVITRKETKEKLAMHGPALYPQFSVLDPEVIKSIPKNQIANGLADAFTHVLEQYTTYPVNGLLQDRMAESIIQTLIEVTPTILKDPGNYDAASNFMWSCTMALNGLIKLGVPEDWTIHVIGHELTALFDIDHARTLAIVTKSHYLHNIDTKKEKLAQLAERVWYITEGNTEDKARAAIDKIDAYFQSLGIKTKLSEYTDEYLNTAQIIADRFTERGWNSLGEHGKITPEDVSKIVTMSY